MDIKNSIKKELIKGKKVEKILLEKLNNLYNNIFRACDDQYNLFDMVNNSNDIYIELKSRGNKINTYQTSIVGTNKIKKSKLYFKKNINSYYMFKFLDCDDIYFIKYDPELFDTFKEQYITIYDRGVTKLHTFIPVKLLQKLTEKSLE